MLETLREVRSQEYLRLWGRVPGTVGSALWIVAVAILGWDSGVWVGALAVALLTLIARTVPSSWRTVEWLVDLAYLTVMQSLVLRLLWLLLVVDLWVAQNKGAWSIPLVLALYVAALILPFLTRRLIKRPLGRLFGRAGMGELLEGANNPRDVLHAFGRILQRFGHLPRERLPAELL